MLQAPKTKIKDGLLLSQKNLDLKNIFEREIESGNLKKSHSMPHKKIRNKTVAVVGLGYVGLPLALLVAQNDYLVIGIDVDKNKIDLLRNKISPFVDKTISDGLLSVKLPVSDNPVFLREASKIIICVPTPIDDNFKPNFKPLINAAQDVAKHLLPNTLVIVESTVNPGVCESIVLPILESGSGLRAGIDFELSHCPERINPGDSKWKLDSINRVVGSLTPKGLRKTVSFYRSIIKKAKITPMKSLKEAEAVKIVENSFRDINIAFVNELAMSFGILGIDVVNVIKGAETKPFGFMAHYPGCGVGGHCIPVDPYYLIEYSKKNGFKHEFLLLARKINNNMPIYTVKVLEKALASKNLPVRRGKITILGASYKPDVDDIRESPAFVIRDELKIRGFEPVLYDPLVKHNDVLTDLEKALDGAIAVIVATAHTPFLSLTPTFFETRGVRVVIDGRNCLNKKLFDGSELAYRGIGR